MVTTNILLVAVDTELPTLPPLAANDNDPYHDWSMLTINRWRSDDLDEMIKWCLDNLAPGTWQGWPSGGVSYWMFSQPEDLVQFQLTWA